MHACLVAQSCLTLCDPMNCSPPGSSIRGFSPGKNTGVGCHFLLQGIFPTQELNPWLLHWQVDSLPLESPGKSLCCPGPNINFNSNLSGEGNGTPLQYSCLGKIHGWRSLVGCSPCGSEESDMTERLHFHFSLSCIGEGNGYPLQCSCPETPRDSGGLPSLGSHRVRHD